MRTESARNIVLAGFMGTGKSAAGRLVADRLGFTFVDTDVEIERRAGCRIAAIFAREGEAAFRTLEAEVCRWAAARDEQVIATGGGALLLPAIRRSFEQTGMVVCLHCDLDEILRRVGDDPARPLFSAERDSLAQLFAARAPVYDSLPHQVDTTSLTLEQAAEEVIRLWQNG